MNQLPPKSMTNKPADSWRHVSAMAKIQPDGIVTRQADRRHPFLTNKEVAMLKRFVVTLLFFALMFLGVWWCL